VPCATLFVEPNHPTHSHTHSNNMSAARQVALVTGANQGIGFHIVRLLATARPQWTVLLGSRDQAKGEAAVKEMKLPNVEAQQIDVDSKESITKAADAVKNKFGAQSLALLVCNAGRAWKGDAFDAEVVDGTYKTNYYGLLDTINTFLPLIPEKGRIVVTSSMSSVSALGKMSPELRQEFLKEDLSIAQLTALLQRFRDAVADGTWEAKGWPKSAYGMSKVGASVSTRVLAKTMPRGITINCGCPGWCRTSMAGDKAPRSAEEGAEDMVHICLRDEKDDTNGAFWEEKKVSSLTRPAKN